MVVIGVGNGSMNGSFRSFSRACWRDRLRFAAFGLLRDGYLFNSFGSDQSRDVPTPASQNIPGAILGGECETRRESFSRVQGLFDQRR